MTLAPPHVVTSTSLAWKLIREDFTLRRALVDRQQAAEREKAKRMLFAEARKRGNAAYLGPAWVAMEIAEANKCAEWAYKACCEVWEIQRRPKCRAFFRGIFDQCLSPMFAARAACFEHELTLHQMRTDHRMPQGNSAIVLQMKMEMGRLRTEWNKKLEIATRDCEYQAQLVREASEPRGPLARASEKIAEELCDEQLRGVFGLSTTAPSPTQPVSSVVAATKPQVERKARALTGPKKKRRKVIFGAIQAGMKGERYCSELDNRGLRPPATWIEQGCPNTYTKAYKDQQWRKRIQDEKCRYREQYEKAPAHEREAIIQGESGTRRTRQ